MPRTAAVATLVRPVRLEATTLVRVGVFAICLAALAHTTADPDLWGHVRFGGDIVATRSVSRVDPYSFTSDRSWVNHEWLAEALMFGAYRALGPAGLVAMKLALLVGILALAARRLRVLPDVMARDRFTALLAIAMLTRTFSFRPQVFSLFLFAALLALLASARTVRWRALAGIPLLMALWVNLHGGWLVGLAVLGLWLALDIVSPRRSLRERAAAVGIGLAACGATLLNPYGVGMWSFLHETVGFTRADVADWQPMTGMPLPIVALWLLVAGVGIAILVRARRAFPVHGAAVAALLGAVSWRVNRIDAFFAIAVVMLLAPALAAAGDRAPPGPAEAGSHTGRRRIVSPAVALLMTAALLVPASVLMGRSLAAIDIPAGFPEPEAARFVVANHLRGRLIPWFGWGEYAIWHFAPAMRVSIDGRRETVYSAATNDANWRFALNEGPDAVAYADRVGADYVWMPNDAPVSSVLVAHGWTPIFAGPVSTIFARQPAGAYAPVRRAAARRGFPGP